MGYFDFAWMVGRKIIQVSFTEPSTWHFSFDAHSGINTESSWRVLEHECIVVSNDDHGQKFGLHVPVDAAARASSLLASAEVKEVNVREGTADIRISLTGDIQLEIIPFSSGYEGWQVISPSGHQTIAQGGGQLFERER
jgi:hypothetical protein